MGIQVLQQFTTPDGFDLSGLYVVLRGFDAGIEQTGFRVNCIFGVYMSREKYKAGASGLYMTFIPARCTFLMSHYEFDANSLVPFMYCKYMEDLTSRGYTISDVLESGQSPYVPILDPVITVDVSGNTVDVSGNEAP
jgi:hypothetical protein